MGLLFINAVILTASDTYRAELLVEGGIIAQIATHIPRDGHRVVDVGNRYLMPGGVDVHTHLALPVAGTVSSDDFETGHIAAAFGGTTTHIDFVNPPRGGALMDGIAQWHEKAAPKAIIDYSYHMSITELTDQTRRDIPRLADEGITTLKLFTAYKGTMQVDDATLFRTMQIARDNGMLVMVHAENGDVIVDLIESYLASGRTTPLYHALSRPALLEGEATARCIALASVANCPLYVVHMTCAESIAQLRLAREHGLPIMGETCPQYLSLTDHFLSSRDDDPYSGAKFVCSPPLRSARDNQILWQALKDGTLQVLSTDHCPFWYKGGVAGRLAGKELGREDFSKIPNGLPVIEERLKLLWHFGVTMGDFSPNKFVELCCTHPAKIFGLYPRKGTIAVGSDADLVIWDAHKLQTIGAANHHMNVDYSVFEGMEFEGGPVAVFRRGEQLVDGNSWLGVAGTGQYLMRAPNAPVL